MRRTYAGFFEELTPEQIARRLSTSLVGPMNVTRVVLPVMRKQRSGLITTISSTAGLIDFEFGTGYAASKNDCVKTRRVKRRSDCPAQHSIEPLHESARILQRQPFDQHRLFQQQP